MTNDKIPRVYGYGFLISSGLLAVGLGYAIMFWGNRPVGVGGTIAFTIGVVLVIWFMVDYWFAAMNILNPKPEEYRAEDGEYLATEQ